MVVSAYVCEFKGWYRLSQPLADALAVGVIAVSAIAAVSADRAERMLMLAHLQSYLQYVLLFQPTSTRNYWLLALLSLGQVAIASTLIDTPVGAKIPLNQLAEVRVDQGPPPRPLQTTTPSPLNDQMLYIPFSPSLGSQQFLCLRWGAGKLAGGVRLPPLQDADAQSRLG